MDHTSYLYSDEDEGRLADIWTKCAKHPISYGLFRKRALEGLSLKTKLIGGHLRIQSFIVVYKERRWRFAFISPQPPAKLPHTQYMERILKHLCFRTDLATLIKNKYVAFQDDPDAIIFREPYNPKPNRI